MPAVERVVFGLFEVEPATNSLLKRGIRIRLSGQPFRILLILLSRAGEIVSQEELRKEIWGEGTFVDFEHGLYTAMNKLRRALSDSAENPRYIETLPGRGYRFIAVIEQPNRALAEKTEFDTVRWEKPVATLETASTPARQGKREEDAPSDPARRENTPLVSHRFQWRWVMAVLTILAVVFAVALRFHRTATVAPIKLTRLTNEGGLANSPALSPDGKLLAWSSDRGRADQRDIYVKQISGGEAIRVTFDGAENTAPDFSPDGTQIVFSSGQNGGGIYTVPALGGPGRRIGPGGHNPKFSPDGASVAYWTGETAVNPQVTGGGSVWIVPSEGGIPRQIGAGLTAARWPIWAPDGKTLLVLGYNSPKSYDFAALDVWRLSADGKEAAPTGLANTIRKAGLYRFIPGPGCWQKGSDRLVVSMPVGDTWNLWAVNLSPLTGRPISEITRLTAAAGSQRFFSCTANAIAFEETENSGNVWMLNLSRGGLPQGALQRVTNRRAVRQHPSVSRDGRSVALASDQAGQVNIWLHDTGTGAESRLAGSPLMQRFPAVSSSGRRIAFSVFEPDNGRAIYASSPGGSPEKLCVDCLRATDWSIDEKSVLTFGGSPYAISILDTSSHLQSVLLRHPEQNLLEAHFSPDNQWISFTARMGSHARIFVAPVSGTRPIPISTWIAVADVEQQDFAGWSADGQTIYFPSQRDGHRCLWGQKFDPISHRMIGEPFAVQHLHGRLTFDENGWSIAGNHIAMVLREDTGNIWIMSP